MTPIQGRWYLISSGSTGYFSNSDKISGTTFDGNNEHFLLCMCVTFFLFFFFTLFTPTSSCDYFLKKRKCGILHLRIFWQRKSPWGSTSPRHAQELGRTGATLHNPAPAQEGAGRREMLRGLSQGRNQLSPVPQPGHSSGLSHLQPVTSASLCLSGAETPNSFTYSETCPWNYPGWLSRFTPCEHILILEWELLMPLD